MKREQFTQRLSGLRFGSRALGLVLFAFALAIFGLAAPAQALPIRDVPGLTAVQVFETTGINRPIELFPAQSPINSRLTGRLSGGNSDFSSPASEFYDVFYSDADGTFNANGAFLTIEAVFDNPSSPTDGGMNIAGARLLTSGGFEYASFVSSFVALGQSALPSTVDNALGDTPGTTTFLGDTVGEPDDVRLRLTLGFDSTRPPTTSLPEPASLPLLGGGLLGLLGVARFVRRAPRRL